VEELHARCAGIDIGKKNSKVCVRVPGPNPKGRRKADRVSETVTTWGSMTNQILALRQHLVEQRVSCVVMEATSDYVRREGA
jgi:transposase